MTTPKLLIAEISASQAQKEVTHNDALRVLDGLVQLAVVTKGLSTPPGSPANGARYIVGASPTGTWVGKAAQIAQYYAGAWYFHAPVEGWRAWVTDEAQIYVYTTGSWTVYSSGGGGAGGTATYDVTFHCSGLAIDEDDILDGFKFPVDTTVNKLLIFARKVPTGADIKIDILKNGVEQVKLSTLIAGQKKEITAYLNVSFLTTDEFGLRIKQVGSTYPGAEITVVAFCTLSSAAATYIALTFPYSGLAIDEDDVVLGFKLQAPGTITKIGLFARKAPVGAALTVDLLKDGVEQGTIATLAAGAKKQLTDIADTAFTTSQEIGVRIKSVGSTTPGSELMVILYGAYP